MSNADIRRLSFRQNTTTLGSSVSVSFNTKFKRTPTPPHQHPTTNHQTFSPWVAETTLASALTAPARRTPASATLATSPRFVSGSERLARRECRLTILPVRKSHFDHLFLRHDETIARPFGKFLAARTFAILRCLIGDCRSRPLVWGEHSSGYSSLSASFRVMEIASPPSLSLFLESV